MFSKRSGVESPASDVVLGLKVMTGTRGTLTDGAISLRVLEMARPVMTETRSISSPLVPHPKQWYHWFGYMVNDGLVSSWEGSRQRATSRFLRVFSSKPNRSAVSFRS